MPFSYHQRYIRRRTRTYWDAITQTEHDYSICGICLTDIDDDPLRLRHCDHEFHFDCLIQSVYYQNITCPVCRCGIITFDRDLVANRFIETTRIYNRLLQLLSLIENQFHHIIRRHTPSPVFDEIEVIDLTND